MVVKTFKIFDGSFFSKKEKQYITEDSAVYDRYYIEFDVNLSMGIDDPCYTNISKKMIKAGAIIGETVLIHLNW